MHRLARSSGLIPTPAIPLMRRRGVHVRSTPPAISGRRSCFRT